MLAIYNTILFKARFCTSGYYIKNYFSRFDIFTKKYIFLSTVVHKKKSYLSQSDCFMCVFISKEKFTVSRNLTRAVEPSNCPALAGKPKLFFIQVNTVFSNVRLICLKYCLRLIL